MPPQSKQLALDFDKLTEKNLQPIVKRFKECGYNVVKVDAPNKAKRESGMLIKTFTLTFEDGQQIQARVKSGGVIYQVRLNNKVVPVKNVDDMKKAVSEMSDYLYGNAKAFARARAQREKRKIKGETRPSVTTNRQEKIAEKRAELEELQQSIANMEKELAEVNAAHAGKNSELEALRAENASLRARYQQLLDEYKSLGGK